MQNSSSVISLVDIFVSLSLENSRFAMFLHLSRCKFQLIIDLSDFFWKFGYVFWFFYISPSLKVRPSLSRASLSAPVFNISPCLNVFSSHLCVNFYTSQVEAEEAPEISEYFGVVAVPEIQLKMIRLLMPLPPPSPPRRCRYCSRRYRCCQKWKARIRKEARREGHSRNVRAERRWNFKSARSTENYNNSRACTWISKAQG